MFDVILLPTSYRVSVARQLLRVPEHINLALQAKRIYNAVLLKKIALSFFSLILFKIINMAIALWSSINMIRQFLLLIPCPDV